MSLLEYLQQARILLRINHVDIGIEVIIFQCFDTISFLFVFSHLLFLFFWLQWGLDNLSLFSNVVNLLLMKLSELFRMEQNFIKEFLVASFLALLLPRTHLLLKAIKSASFFLATRINLWTLIKLSINKLSFIKKISLGLLTMSKQGYFVLHVSL